MSTTYGHAAASSVMEYSREGRIAFKANATSSFDACTCRSNPTQAEINRLGEGWQKRPRCKDVITTCMTIPCRPLLVGSFKGSSASVNATPWRPIPKGRGSTPRRAPGQRRRRSLLRGEVPRGTIAASADFLARTQTQPERQPPAHPTTVADNRDL